MDANQEGLNYVPFLAQSPIFKRRVLSYRRSATPEQDCESGYNGNYEGDASMFSCPESTSTPRRSTSILHLDESDSDTQYQKEADEFEIPNFPDGEYRSPMKRLWDHFKAQLLSEQHQEQLDQFTERLEGNIYYQHFARVVRLVATVLFFVLRWLFLALVCVGSWSYGLWRSRSLLRQAARRILWSMTLAKCNDASFFALILLAAPMLFAISVCGFLISCYCAVKTWLTIIESFIRQRMF